ncbi:hypothetical protein HK104_000404 [Borealophlyctis nickersoniae]|nr:hypothetical protein HK104_000404 [Borealophlyctis nickersoniae]
MPLEHPEFPPSLKSFLEDPLCRKAGVNIRGDARKLLRDYEVQMAGMVDLSSLAKAVAGVPRLSLQNLVEKLLEKTLNKDDKIRTGNWANAPLNAKQEAYAANDAYASYKIYTTLMTMRSKLPRADKVAPLVLLNMVDILREDADKEARIGVRRVVDRRPADDYFESEEESEAGERDSEDGRVEVQVQARITYSEVESSPLPPVKMRKVDIVEEAVVAGMVGDSTPGEEPSIGSRPAKQSLSTVWPPPTAAEWIQQNQSLLHSNQQTESEKHEDITYVGIGEPIKTRRRL